MMGLMALGFFSVYLLVSIWVTSKAAGLAKVRNRKPWLWGGIAAFVMYNLVFWDLIPTLVMHKYYCDTQAGFWVYKTPEQWMKENPKMRVLSYEERKSDDYLIERMPDGGNKTTYTMKSNIKYLNYINPILFLTKNRRVEEVLFDKKQKNYLARKVTFQSGHVSGAPRKLSHYRFWINLQECNGRNGNVDKSIWEEATNEYRKLGE